ncbi:MAG: class II aldolase [Pusillimonas sp.]|nr:class II aldolase [Pusillimonas sp.]MBC41798.1 class II aldolase [Pusillimonas sp.]|tara:strand:- start:964 stop:1722 length:759 start_codon:yes stop_codon:yes gene_type:complete
MTTMKKTIDCSDDEWERREKLAYCYRLVDYFGWTETIFNHISLRLSGPEHQYLVNPFGLNYSEVTPANLLKVDLEGNRVAPSEYEANPAGFALHSAVHGAREDIQCLIHTHTTPISAVAQKQSGFDHNNFYGAQLFGRVAYHDFEGITLFADEKRRMISSLGSKHVLVLRNHGVAVGEGSVETAFFLLWTVQRAAEIQCQAASMQGDETVLADEVRQRCADLTAMLIRKGAFADQFFNAMVRKMHAEKGACW